MESGSNFREASAAQLDNSDNYVKVPHKLKKQVEQILALIEKGENGDKAA